MHSPHRRDKYPYPQGFSTEVKKWTEGSCPIFGNFVDRIPALLEDMEIKEIGKEGLLKRLYTQFRRPETLKGEDTQGGNTPGTMGGYDRALDLGGNQLSSSVMLMEGVDFDLVYFPLQALGYKTVTAAISGVTGCGGKVRALSLLLALSGRFQVEDVETFMRGVHEACTLYDVELRALDLTSSLTGFAISATAYGERILGVSEKAEVNDLICVTGDLGAAYMGLQLMIREKGAFEKSIGFEPDFGGREYILERQLMPTIPVRLLSILKDARLAPTYMRVLRRGLNDAIVHLAEESEVGCRIYEPKLPIDFQTARMAEDFGIEPTLAALHGGEDYQVLFTIPLTEREKVESIEGVRLIGFITDASEGLTLVDPSGGSTPLRQGEYA